MEDPRLMRLDDPDKLDFRAARRAHRSPRRTASWGWWLLAVVAAVGFVLVIRLLLARTAWTAGPSPQPAAMDAPAANPPARTVEYLPMPTPMVYRCVDRAGAVSFQSWPCGPGQRTTKALPATPDVEPVRRASPRVSPPARNASTQWVGTDQVDPDRAAARTRCAIARNQREATLRAAGLTRTYDLLQRLDDVVREACKEV